MKILLIEGEVLVTYFIQRGLDAEGDDLQVAYNGLTGKAMFDQHVYDVVILAENMLGMNGIELCRHIKQHSPHQAVLLLTTLDNLLDKETGFGAGADDYLTKPFEFRELLLRIRTLASRAETDPNRYLVLRVANLELNTRTRTVSRDGQLISLAYREYALLYYLMTRPGVIVSQAELAEKGWGLRFTVNSNIIDMYIRHLSNKIDQSFEPLLHTVLGQGYRLGEPSEAG